MSLLAVALCTTQASAGTVKRAPYGTLKDGRTVGQWTLRNQSGMTVRFIALGAIITDVVVPGKDGKRANVALGFSKLADYEARNADYGFGAVIGRFAGRIADARFSIDGREVRLKANDGPNTLHGGGNGFDSKLWAVRPLGDGSGAALSYRSAAGEQGFPGALTVRVTYRLLEDDALRIDYEAVTDAPTVINLTNHSYFNLAGAGSGTALDHRLQVFADRYAEASESGIPTGTMPLVADTPFDFRRGTAVRSQINVAHPQMTNRRGYNHSWLLRGGEGDTVRLAARLWEASSGRTMEVWTSEPVLHLYTANWFSGKDRGAQGTLYAAGDGIALETQHLSDAPNQVDLPSTLLRPGEIYRSTTIYRFNVGDR